MRQLVSRGAHRDLAATSLHALLSGENQRVGFALYVRRREARKELVAQILSIRGRADSHDMRRQTPFARGV